MSLKQLAFLLSAPAMALFAAFHDSGAAAEALKCRQPVSTKVWHFFDGNAVDDAQFKQLIEQSQPVWVEVTCVNPTDTTLDTLGLGDVPTSVRIVLDASPTRWRASVGVSRLQGPVCNVFDGDVTPPLPGQKGMVHCNHIKTAGQ